MNDPLGKNFISTKEASEQSGYSADYLSRLCREGKIEGRRIGRSWVIARASLNSFTTLQEKRKQAFAVKLSHEREREYRAHAPKQARVGASKKSPYVASYSKSASALALGIVAVGSLVAGSGSLTALGKTAYSVLLDTRGAVIASVGDVHADALAFVASGSEQNYVRPDVRVLAADVRTLIPAPQKSLVDTHAIARIERGAGRAYAQESSVTRDVVDAYLDLGIYVRDTSVQLTRAAFTSTYVVGDAAIAAVENTITATPHIYVRGVEAFVLASTDIGSSVAEGGAVVGKNIAYTMGTREVELASAADTLPASALASGYTDGAYVPFGGVQAFLEGARDGFVAVSEALARLFAPTETEIVVVPVSDETIPRPGGSIPATYALTETAPAASSVTIIRNEYLVTTYEGVSRAYVDAEIERLRYAFSRSLDNATRGSRGGSSSSSGGSGITSIDGLSGSGLTLTNSTWSGGTITGSTLDVATTTVAGSVTADTFIARQYLAGPYVLATSTTATSAFSGNIEVGRDATFGTNASDTLTVNSRIGSSLVPTADAVYDIGAPSAMWRRGYFDELIVNNLSIASSSVSGTASDTFTINSDNATNDTEDMSLVFTRGTASPDATLTWNATTKRFEFNMPVYAPSASFANATSTYLGVGTSSFVSLLGSGLLNTGGYLTLDRTGAWTGTFDGQEGSYYLANAFSTTSADVWLANRSTTNLVEGSNLYFTNARVQTYLDSLSKGYFFSTTSANYWETQQTARTADDLTNNSLEDLGDVGSFTQATGDILSWNGSEWVNVATSSLGIASAVWGNITGSIANQTDLQTALNNRFLLADWYATTTDALDEGSSNLYFTNARARSALSGGSGITYSTTTGVISLNASGDWTGTLDGQEGSYYLNRANHTGTQTASTISDFSSAARALFSDTITGITYTSGTGVFSLDSGYTIPLTASTTDWNTAYLNRITSASAPLSITNNVLSISQASASTNGFLSSTDWSSFNARLSTSSLALFDKGYFYSTTSADYWKSVNNFFSTTSADAWLTTKSTSNLGEGSNLYYTDARVNSYVAASTTIPKTYTSNTFTGTNAFTGGVTLANATSTSFFASVIGLGADYITDFTGTGLTTINGVLTVATSSLANLNADLLDGLDSTFFLSNSFSTTSADYWRTQRNFFSTTSADAWLTTKSTTNLAEGTNLYYTDARARSAISETVSGLDYSSATGVFSLTSGFSIPLTASTTDWNTAYLNRISSVTYPLQFANNILSLAFGTTTSNTWAGTQTFGNLVATNATSTSLFTSLFGLGGDYLSDVTGSGLINVNGALTVSTSSFSGTGSNLDADLLDGQSGSYYLSRANHTGTQLASTISDFSTTARGLFSGTYPVQYNSGTGVFSLAFGTTTSNTWAGTQTFANLVATNATSTSLFGTVFGVGSDYITDLTGSGLTISAGALTLDRTGDWTGTFDGQEGSFYLASSFSTTSANYWKSVNNFFSTTSADYWKTVNNFYSTTSANAWLATKSTSDLLEGTNLYFTDARARLSLSESITGIDYSNTTGVFSLTSGYNIPLTASTTDWNSAYLNRITSATYPVQIANNVISLAFGTTSSNTWAGTQTFTNAVSVGAGTSTFGGNISISGSIIPTADNTYSLGSPNYMWRDVYIGPGTLYINGQAVLQEDGANDIIVSADATQNIQVQTSGGGNIELNPVTGSILLRNSVVLTSGKTIRSSNGVDQINFPDGTDSGNIRIYGNTVSAKNTNGGIELTPAGNGGVYVTSGNFGIATTSPSQKLSVSGNAYITGTTLISGLATLASGLSVNGDTITDFTGTGLTVSGGALTVSTGGDWTGTFDGQEGSYYLSRANHTGTQLASTISDFSTTARGLFSGTYPVQYNSGTGAFSLAFGTTTANTWSAQNTFSGLFAANASSTNATSTTFFSSVLGLGSDYITDLTGSGLINQNGVLTVSTSSLANLNADLLDGFDSTYFLANSFSTTSANYWKSVNNFFSTTSADYWKSVNNFYSTTSADAWLATKSTTNLAEGTNLYYTDARARGSVSETVSGLDYNNSTGVLSLTSGFNIPLTASTTDWNTAYLNRITSAAYPLQIANNVISLLFGTTTSNTWAGTQTFATLTASDATITRATTTNATTTNIYVSGQTRLGSLSGLLRATGGIIGTSLVSLTADVSGTLPVGNGGTGLSSVTENGILIGGSGNTITQVATSALNIALGDTTGTLGQTRGGTGFTSYTAGDILYADGSGNLTRLPIGSTGQVLKVTAGLPAWGADQTLSGGGSGDGVWATSTDIIYPVDTSYRVLVGTNATSTANSVFEVIGQSYFSNRIGIATTAPATTLSVGGSGYFTGGVGIGLLNTTAGTLQTSGAVTFGGLSTLSGGFLATGSSTINGNATTTGMFGAGSIFVNGDRITDFTGSGIVLTGGALTVSTSSLQNLNADLLDGLDSTYFLANSFSTTSADYWKSVNNFFSTTSADYWKSVNNFYSTTSADAWLATKSTTDLLEGTNLYYTDARARSAISETINGVDYNNGTGVFSLTSGYTIPLTASTTDWNTAYLNRITSASAPLSITNNVLSISQANASTNGFLSSTDWTSFNSRLSTSTLALFDKGYFFSTTSADAYINASTTIPNPGGGASGNVISWNGLRWASVATSTLGLQAAGNYITALTGDVTATGPGSVTATLATVNSNTGSFGGASSIPTFTVNGKGLITAAGSVAVVAPAGTLSGTTLNSTVVTSSLTSVGTLTSLNVSGLATLSGGFLATGSSTINGNATTTGMFGAGSIFVNGDRITDFTGTGIVLTGGALTVSTSSLANLNADLLDSLDSTYFLANSFSTTSANYWKSVNNFFSTSSADYWKSVNNFYSTTSADYWLTTKSTTNLAEGTNLYYTDARARASVSETVTGIDYNNSTGVFSLASGYTIPLTASTTDWNTAYLNRITAATYPIQIANNTISLAFGTTTSNTWAGTQAFATLTATDATITNATTTNATSTNIYVSGQSRLNALAGTGTRLVAAGPSGILTNISTSSLGLLTTDVAEGSNLYFTNARVQTYLDTVSKGYFFSTTSADFWSTQRNFYSTTSADYWLTTKSTSNLAEGTNLYYTDARVNSYIAASTTIAKTYVANTWSQLQTFSAGFLATGSSTINGSATTTGQFGAGSIFVNGDRITDFTGSGIALIGGALTVSTSSLQNLNADLLDGLDSTYFLANSFSTSSADYWKSVNNFYSTTSADAWLATKSTTNLAEGTNLYYTDARARSAISETITGVDYNNGTGVFSLTSGYTIPLTASTTNWNTFYDTPSNRIAAGNGLAWVGNTLRFDSAFGTTTTNTWTALQTFSAGFLATGSSTINGSATTTGQFGAGSLFVNNDRITDFTGSGLTLSGGALTLDRTGDWTGTFDGQEGSYYLANSFSTTSANAWLATKDTDSLTEGATNLYFTNARARTAISETIAGVDYNNSTGVFSLTSGYTIPLTASTTDWNTAYLNRITAATYPIQIANNTISLAFGTTTSNTWAGTQTFATLTATNGTVTNLIATNATSTNATTTNIYVSGQTRLNALAGTGTRLVAAGVNGILTNIATSSLGLLTTDVAEGSNLYFTNARVQTYLDSVSKGYFFSTTSANAWLATKDTDSLTEGATNLYFTNARARTAISETITGVDYNNSTGVFSLTSGYTIPLTASTTNWNTFYDTPSARITAGNGLIWSGNTLATSFGTTTANVWTALQTFSAGFLATGSSTINGNATTTGMFGAASIFVNNDRITDFTGTGITLTGGALTLDATGDWTGTFDGREGSFYLANSFSTTSANAWLATKDTDSLTEGATNLYFTNARARGAISETITGIDYTSGTGVFSLTSGYNIPLTASTTNWNTFYDTPSNRIAAGNGLAWVGNTLRFDSAFGTTTTNTWTALNTFSGGALFSAGATFQGSTTAASSTVTTLNGTNAFFSNRITAAFASTTAISASGNLNVTGTATAGSLSVGSLSGVLYGNSGTVTSVATSAAAQGTGISLSGSAALVGTGGLTITNTGVLSVAQSFGTGQTGAITLATSSAATSNGVTVGQTITNSSGTFTFTPTVSVANIPNAALANSSISLAIGSTGTDVAWGASSVALGGTATLNIPTASASARGLLSSADWTSFNSRLSTSSLALFDKGYFFSTTSADVWLTTKSTTNLAEGSNLYYTDARVNSYVAASTTIAKTYTANTWTNSQQFNSFVDVIGDLTTNDIIIASNGFFSDAVGSPSYLLGNFGLGTSTPSQRLGVQGNALISGNLTAANITATGTTNIAGTLTLATSLNGPLQANAGVVSATTSIGVLYGGTGATTAAGARTNLGLVIGTNVQAWDADLDTWATKTAPSGVVVGTTDSQTLTNKTFALGSNTFSGTLAQFNTALTDADFVSLDGSETLTNKTLTTPTINGAALSGTFSGTPSFSGLVSLAGGFLATGSSTINGNATTTGMFGAGSIFVGGDRITDFTGTGLSLTNGALTISTSSLYTGTTGQVAYFNATNNLIGTSSIFLATSGNVGIGSISPDVALEVNGTIDGTILQVGGVTRIANNGTITAKAGNASSPSFQFTANSGSGIFSTGASDGLGFATNGTEQARISLGGNFGIGSTSPAQRLSVQGDAYISGDLTTADITATGTASISGLATLSSGFLATGSSTINGSATTTGQFGAGSIFVNNDRITDFTGTNLTVTGGALGLSSTYTGQSSITTLGTISTGVWQGSEIADTYISDALTLNGATINSSNIVGAFTTTGALAIGDGGDTIAFNSSNWDVSTAGVFTGLTGLTSSGNITFSGLTPNRLVVSGTGGLLQNTITAANLVASVSDIASVTGTGSLVLSTSSLLATPTIEGATLSGTFTGSPTFSGVPTFSGGALFSAGATFQGSTTAASSTVTTLNGTNAFFSNRITTAFASTTALSISGNLTLATSLNGPLHANAGVVSATSSIGVLYGGTGLTSVANNALLMGSGGNTLSTISAGTNGFVLAMSAGTPTWVSTSSIASSILGTNNTWTGYQNFTGGVTLGTASSSSFMAASSTITAGTTTFATSSQFALTSLTSGRVPFATTGGRLIDSSSFTFNSAASRLTATYASSTALSVSGNVNFGAGSSGAAVFGTPGREGARVNIDGDIWLDRNATFVSPDITDGQGMYLFANDQRAVFQSEQDETSGEFGGFRFVMDDDSSLNPTFQVVEKSASTTATLFEVHGDGDITIADLTGTGTRLIGASATGTLVTVATSTLGLGNGTFLGLSDTLSSYTANRVIFTNSAGTALTDNAGFTFNATAARLTATYASTTALSASGNLNVTGSGTFGSLSVGSLSGVLYGNNGSVVSSATSTPSLGLGLSYSGTLGSFVGGASGSLSIATSSLYTGTTGQVPYFSATNSLIGTSSIFLATSGNVGIGNTTPATQLAVGPSLAIDGTYSYATTTLFVSSLSNNGGDVLAPMEPVLVLGREGISGQSWGNFVEFSIGRYEDNSVASRSRLDINLTHNNLSGGLAVPATVMTLLSSGNVGLGTTSPSEALSVQGNGLISGNLTVGNVIATGTATSTSLAITGFGAAERIPFTLNAAGTLTSSGAFTFNNAASRLTATYASTTALSASGNLNVGGVGVFGTGLTVSANGLTVTGNSTITGTLSSLTGLTSSGTITFSGLTANRLVVTTTGGQLTNTITAANLASSVTGTTGTGDLVFADSPTFTTQLSAPLVSLDTNGVLLDTDGDGALVLTGNSTGSDESLTINLDDTSNTVDITSTSGVSVVDFNGISVGSSEGFNGMYSNTGATSAWGGAIWGIDSQFTGTSNGLTYQPSGMFGIAWLRASHGSSTSAIGEGMYVYGNGVRRGGIGSGGLSIGAADEFNVSIAGVVTAGTWQGSQVTVPYGGTGLTSVANNALLMGSGGNTLSTISAGTNGFVLAMSAGTPTWVSTSSIASSILGTANTWTALNTFSAGALFSAGATFQGSTTAASSTITTLNGTSAFFTNRVTAPYASTTAISITGTASTTNLVVSSLTANRLVVAGTGGALQAANNVITAANLVASVSDIASVTGSGSLVLSTSSVLATPTIQGATLSGTFAGNPSFSGFPSFTNFFAATASTTNLDVSNQLTFDTAQNSLLSTSKPSIVTGLSGTNSINALMLGTPSDFNVVLDVNANDANSDFAIYNHATNTTPLFFVDDNALIGIGTSSPGSVLTIEGDGSSMLELYRISASANNGIQFRNDTSSWYAGQGSGGNFNIDTDQNIGNLPLFTFATGGEFGIGTTTPRAHLAVQGNGLISGNLTVANFIATGTANITGRLTTSFASTTALSASGNLNVTGSGTFGSLSVGSLSGVLYGNNGSVLSSATSTPSLGLGLSYSGTLGSFVGGASGSLSVATSSLYTGTTGQFPYFSATNTLTATSSLFLATSENVGIGTTTPQDELTIDRSVNSATAISISNFQGGTAANAQLSLRNSIGSIGGLIAFSNGSNLSGLANRLALVSDSTNSGGITFIAPGATSDIRFVTAGITGNERMTIDSTGYVGIGTTTPATKLHVQAFGSFTGSVNSNNIAIFANNNTSDSIAVVGVVSGSNATSTLTLGGDGASTYNNGRINYFAPTDTLSFATADVDRVFITSSGELGIGTSSPATTLSVAGSGYLTGGLGIGVRNTTTGTLQTSSTITSGGNIFFPSSSYVGTNTNNNYKVLGGTGYINAAGSFSVNVDSTNTGTGEFAVFRGASDAGGTRLMTLTYGGNLGIGTSSPYRHLSISASSGGGAAATAIANPAAIVIHDTAGGNTWNQTDPFAVLEFSTGDSNEGTRARIGTVMSQGNGNSSRLGFFTGANIGAQTERFTIAQDGLVGINNTSPFERLTITGNIALTGNIVASGTASTTGLTLSGVNTSGATRCLQITAAGQIQAASGACGTGGGGVTGSTGQIAWLSGTDTAVGTSTIFLSSATSYVGIGTTSPAWKFQVAGARPSFALTDMSAGTNLKHWLFSSMGGNLYLSTSTDALATSTMSAFTINANGKVGIGTTTPSAQLTVIGGGVNGTEPSLLVATTSNFTGAQRPLLLVTATTTGKLDYARVAIGTTSPWGGAGLRDQFTVDGRMYSTWRYMSCDTFGSSFTTTAVSADTAQVCGGFMFDADTDGHILFTNTNQSTSPVPFADITPGQTTSPATGEAAAIRFTQQLTSATTSPVIEVWGMASTSAAATSTPYYFVGFTGATYTASTDYAAVPVNGIYFTASTSPNWKAVTRANNVETMTDTGIATSTNFQISKFRIEANENEVIFMINGNVRARHTSNIPVVNLSPFVSAGVQFAGSGNLVGLAPRFRLSLIRFWMDDPPGATMLGGMNEGMPDEFDPITGADIAEAYLGDDPGKLIPGIIVANSTTTDNQVRRSVGKYDNDIMGAITTSPKLVLGDEASTTVRVALTGRVPVIVTLENGPIKKGDRITSSSIVGIGMKALRPGMVVGKALSDFDPENQAGFCDENLKDELTALGYVIPEGTCVGRVMVFLTTNFDMTVGSIVQDVGEIPLDVVSAVAELANAAFNKGAELTKFVVGQVVAQIAIIEKTFTKVLTVLPDGEINVASGSDQISGRGELAGGATSIFINNPKVGEGAKIFLTPRALIASPLVVTEIVPGSGFKVQTAAATTNEVPFDFLIVNTYGGSESLNLGGGSTTPPPQAPAGEGSGGSTPPPTSGGGNGDTTPPDVSLTGSAAMSVEQGGAWSDPGATATDDVDGNLTSSITVSGSVDTTTPGIYTITYSASDAAGNTGSASRVVTVASTGGSAPSEPPPSEPSPEPPPAAPAPEPPPAEPAPAP